MQVSKNFELKEFIPPDIMKVRGDKAIELIDERIIKAAQLLRDLTNSTIIINGTLNGHEYVNSGLRDFNCKEGAYYSQHKYGRAIDTKVIDWTAEKLRQLVRNNWEKFKAVGITTMEKDTPTWLHLDCRYTTTPETLYEIPYQ